MKVRSRKSRSVGVALFAAIALMLTATASLAAVPFDVADFSGYATGNALLHGDVLAASGVHVVDAEEALSAAAVRSKGLSVQVVNEMGRVVSPNLGIAKKTHAQGSGLELGLGVPSDVANQLELQKVEASAPPSQGPLVDQVLELPAGPLAYAAVLRGAAEANWSDSSTCVIGKDLAAGLGHAADVQLVDAGAGNANGTLELPLIAADAPDPNRRVMESFSHNFLDVQQNEAGQPKGLAFGLASEVRETIAPITLFKGTPNQLTIEIGGQWVLKAFAGGIPGTSWVHYGVGEVSPSTPLLTVLDSTNAILGQILTQDVPILGDAGLVVTIPGVAEIAIGEDPRAIGGDADTNPQITADGTVTGGAVDVVRVKLLDGELGDIRVGHMEVAAKVPAGGIDCGVPVSKSATPKGVTIGQSFVVSIKVSNPFGCDMTAVKLVDVITTDGDAKFQVLATAPVANTVPAGSNLDSGTIVWNNIGPILKGQTKTVTATIRAQGSGGIIKDIATATATLGNCEGEGDGSQLVGNSLPLLVPVVLSSKLPTTGVNDTAAILAGLMLIGVAVVGIRFIRRTV